MGECNDTEVMRRPLGDSPVLPISSIDEVPLDASSEITIPETKGDVGRRTSKVEWQAELKSVIAVTKVGGSAGPRHPQVAEVTSRGKGGRVECLLAAGSSDGFRAVQGSGETEPRVQGELEQGNLAAAGAATGERRTGWDAGSGRDRTERGRDGGFVKVVRRGGRARGCGGFDGR